MKRVFPILLIFFLFSFRITAFAQDKTVSLFQKKCMHCHSHGKEDGIGPDLKDLNQWPLEAILEATRRMQLHTGPLPEEEMQTLAAFLKNPGQAIYSNELQAIDLVWEQMLGVAILFALLFLGSLSYLYRFRNQGVRQQLFQRHEEEDRQ